MSALIERIKHIFIIFLQAGTAIAMMGVFGIILANALWRYGAGKSLVWGEEAAIYCMIFGVMLGIAQACLLDMHVRFTVGFSMLSSKNRRACLLLADLLILVIGIGLAYSGYEFLIKRGRIDSTGLGIPMWTMQSSMVIGGVLVSLASVIKFFDRLFAKKYSAEQ